MQAIRAMLAVFVLTGVAEASKISLDLDKGRPVSKVVNLLKGMAQQLEKEGEEDEKTYDEFKCWCKTNLEEKGKAVEEAQAHLTELKERVTVLAAKKKRLVSEIEKAEDEKAKNEAALDTANHLRNQQNGEYNDDKTRITGDIDAVSNALSAFAVAGGSGGSFLQSSSATARPFVQQIFDKHEDRLRDEDREVVQAFLQEESGSPTDAVVGVLSGLKDEFTADMKKVQDDEDKQLGQFKELDAAKTAEIQAGITLIEDKKMQKADAAEEAAMKKQEIKDTEASIGGDAEFTKEVEKQCGEMDAEWDERSKTRAEETTAISKAIATLDSESSHDLFGKSLSFIQESTQSGASDRAKRASEVVAQAAKNDARMKGLAMQMKLDNFGKVKKAMDEMTAALKKESADEVEQRDFCIKSFRENQMATDDETREKNGLATKEATMKSTVAQLKKELESLTDQVAELKKQLQLASQNREKENSEFQTVIAEQRQTQVLLKQALDVLGQFYNKGALVQIKNHANPKAPGGFKDYKKNGQSFGVMGMIRQILKDTAAMEAEGTRAEKSAQGAYEDFAKETTSSTEEKEAMIGDKKEEKAKAEKAEVEARKGKEGSEAELANLADALAKFHDSCDFLMKNFDTRMEARQDEMDSIEKAKQILSGATFAEIQLS
mmetsp:Transcript_104298/g.185419  ORF Transcript_104298/g.185419 Transcript_104298/m.185419 type:complete len:663 (+) Transcript_104298:79-2067(+)